MKHTVIFDMDGVIIDSEPIHMEIEQAMFDAYNIRLTEAEHTGFVGTSTKNMWQTLKEKFALAPTVEELVYQNRKYFLDYLKSHPAIQPIEGVRPLVEALSTMGHTLVLASSAGRENIETVLERLELTGHFPVQVSGDELPHSKPHPEIFLKAAGLVKVLPEHCLVIEDSANGVKAAKAAGMKCIGFQNPNSGNQDLRKADLIVKKMTEVTLDVVRQLLR
ncbi:HAD family phosphatase [Rapidithrix thailandica]|uniref:HAD family phosphatase n=1 Tax=Rapidithrix thailandica TaxID=413964 RepID=A0AAW9SBI5_9BACT